MRLSDSSAKRSSSIASVLPKDSWTITVERLFQKERYRTTIIEKSDSLSFSL
ncbi:hypothetical protein V512_001720 [Mesotoga sp. Brook.08.105.5.1]|nr:hypothetical protein V512_001720 [Mesotoga sp. Brook.08.105.5.1]RAO98220.1 hypothetical protein M388_07745 [Mesotoga sp. Brook.08.YT.4.2.5.4.]